MELKTLKRKWLEDRTQILEVDNKGLLLASCNTLFNADIWINKPVGEFFHLAASTFPYWDDWHKHNWVYQGLELQVEDYNGLVDVYLEKHATDSGSWLIFIMDHSDSYRKFQQVQTKRNLNQM
jgi:hypothetical protein